MLRIGIDIGGTFTDFVIHNSQTGEISTFKLPTQAVNPASTVLEGLKSIPRGEPMQIVHGSTVATNALLERKGACTALITTRGFRDVLQIGRQNRPQIYDWFVKLPPVLVPEELRFEVDERIDYQGNVLTHLDLGQMDDLIVYLTQVGVESVAICLLFSFLYPIHEHQILEKLQNKGFFLSASSDILPEYREYERTSTTVVNAYVSPIVDRYLSILEESLPQANLQIMQSNGGMISLREARSNGVRCILSGPAGGIVGSQHIVRALQNARVGTQINQDVNIITFDMGGTSTDVSLIKDQPRFNTEAVVGGCPIHLPLLDIHTIGAGGGSIASMDAGGSLRVGPQSVGSNPGPACYGRGNLPTVTDANVVLGRIIPDYFLGGKMKIFPERSLAAMSRLGEMLKLSQFQAAYGVIDVVNIQMERALRVISVERGYDPREFSLFSFGGAGGLHASDLAHSMGIPRVLISRFASTLSAFGMLASDVVKDYVLTVMLPGTIKRVELDSLFSPLEKRGKDDLIAQGFNDAKIDIQRSLDIRFAGQSYELNIPFTANFQEKFLDVHRSTYGYAYPDKAIEIVNLRVKAVGKTVPVPIPRIKSIARKVSPKPRKQVTVWMRSGPEILPMYQYEDLLPETSFRGPAIIVSPDTTIMISRKDIVEVDSYLNLIIDTSANNSERSQL